MKDLIQTWLLLGIARPRDGADIALGGFIAMVAAGLFVLFVLDKWKG